MGVSGLFLYFGSTRASSRGGRFESGGQDPPADGDRLARGVEDREYQPRAKRVLAAIALVHEAEARADQHLLTELQRAAQRIPLVGGPAELELTRDLAADATRAKVVARRTGVGSIEQAVVVPLDRVLHRGEQLLALLARRAGVGILVEFDPRPIRQHRTASTKSTCCISRTKVIWSPEARQPKQ